MLLTSEVKEIFMPIGIICNKRINSHQVSLSLLIYMIYQGNSTRWLAQPWLSIVDIDVCLQVPLRWPSVRPGGGSPVLAGCFLYPTLLQSPTQTVSTLDSLHLMSFYSSYFSCFTFFSFLCTNVLSLKYRLIPWFFKSFDKSNEVIHNSCLRPCSK